MNQSPSLPELKVFWIIGALERLAGLGIIQDPVYQIKPEKIDMFIEVDEHRDYIFCDDEEVKEYTLEMITQESPNTPKSDIEPIVDFVLRYKNDRTQLVKDCMKLKDQVDS